MLNDKTIKIDTRNDRITEIKTTLNIWNKKKQGCVLKNNVIN